MEITIANIPKLFCYAVKWEHYEKFIGIKELLERLGMDCFKSLSKPTQGFRKTTYLHLMKLITKALRLSVQDSNITVLLLAIKISSQYRRSQFTLILVVLLGIRLQRKLKRREGGIIGRLGVTLIWGYLMERDVWRGVSSTAMVVQFGLGVVPNTVNRMAVTDLRHITNPSLQTVDMFSVWIIIYNHNCLV